MALVAISWILILAIIMNYLSEFRNEKFINYSFYIVIIFLIIANFLGG